MIAQTQTTQNVSEVLRFPRGQTYIHTDSSHLREYGSPALSYTSEIFMDNHPQV